MPAPITQDIKLKEIIFGYNEATKTSEAEFKRLWRLAFKGFKQMGLSAFWEPRTVILQVDQNNKTADVPENCLQWIKIGQFNWQGELQTLRVNEQLTTFHDGLPTRLQDIVPEIQAGSDALLNNWWINGFDYFSGNDGTYGNDPPLAWGSKMIQNGECWFDRANQKIILNSLYAYNEVILEYICSPEMDDDYAIPMQFEMAMHAWLGWQDIAYLPATSHMNNNNIEMRARMFKGQLALAKRMYKPIRLQELWQELIESQTLSIKP